MLRPGSTRLAALRPELRLDVENALLTTWADDPWARGAYSADSVAALPGDADLLARPVGSVHVAGEWTAGAWSGLMEGGLRSGLRAAEEILTWLASDQLVRVRSPVAQRVRSFSPISFTGRTVASSSPATALRLPNSTARSAAHVLLPEASGYLEESVEVVAELGGRPRRSRRRTAGGDRRP